MPASLRWPGWSPRLAIGRRQAPCVAPRTARAQAENIWREASDYYLLGYWPSTDRREIHKVEVSSDWKGVHLRARKRR